MPTIVPLELSKWLRRERSQDPHDRVIAFAMTRRIIPLDTGIALEAADLCRTPKLATARLGNADLPTCDAHFEGLAGVLYRAKPATP